MSYSSAKRRRIKPLARPTSFDINVSFDIRHYQNVKYGNVINPYFNAVTTGEAFHVMEGEILMKYKKGQGVTYRDHQLHAFSFANGLKVPNAILNSSLVNSASSNDAAVVDGNNNINVGRATRQAVLGQLDFAGIAVTGFKPEVDVFEQGFVSTLGGLNTIFNNGRDTIHAGDVLAVDLPETVGPNRAKRRALQTGVPSEKLQFVVRPFEKMVADYGVNPSELSSYIIGTALSYSRAGQPVDIVLHRCNRFGFSVAQRGAADDGGGGGGDDDDDDAFGNGGRLLPSNNKKKRKSKKKSAPTITAETTQ